jgi:RNA polymerase sigma-70 factor, ECF subfamily
MPEPLTTQVLIDRVQHGDEAALNALCTRYQERVLRAVRIRLGAKLRAKLQSSDVVQDVMKKAVEGIDRFEFRTEGAFMKHLNVLVEHRIRDQNDYWNAQRRNPGREIPLGPRSSGDGNPLIEPEARPAPGPSSLLILAEDLERMERAMDLLSPEQRELLVAVKLEGRTYGELAEEHGTTDDAIRMKAKRAEMKLAAIYHELETGES